MPERLEMIATLIDEVSGPLKKAAKVKSRTFNALARPTASFHHQNGAP
jgi:hypothetical protein